MRTAFKTTAAKEIFGIPQSTYTRIENGEFNASGEVAEKIAAYFKVPVGTIFNVERYSAASIESAKAIPAPVPESTSV